MVLLVGSSCRIALFVTPTAHQPQSLLVVLACANPTLLLRHRPLARDAHCNITSLKLRGGRCALGGQPPTVKAEAVMRVSIAVVPMHAPRVSAASTHYSSYVYRGNPAPAASLPPAWLPAGCCCPGGNCCCSPAAPALSCQLRLSEAAAARAWSRRCCAASSCSHSSAETYG